MTAPHAILLVPTEAGAALLAGGRYGARAPSVHLAQSPNATWCDCEDGGLYYPSALPLWWDGALVPEGIDRAIRVLGDIPDAPHADRWAAPMALARVLEAAGLCRVVLLDLVDGRLVERAP